MAESPPPSAESPLKRRKLDSDIQPAADTADISGTATAGIADVKTEFRAEPLDVRDNRDKNKKRGQNKNRRWGSSRDAIRLCSTRVFSPELEPEECRYGAKCRDEHDLRKYLAEKRDDLDTFGTICPVWEARGVCDSGWKCRFLRSHVEQVEQDGKKGLVLVVDAAKQQASDQAPDYGIKNIVSARTKEDLQRRRYKTEKADEVIKYLDAVLIERDEHEMTKINAASYIEPPFLTSEKRRLYFGADTPVLAPLTTQGNLPFRRLCIDLGAQLTYSEMALSVPLIQGHKPEWALMRAHRVEAMPPNFTATDGYDNSRDSRFGTQISAARPWQAIKAAEVLSALCPSLRLIDLNCGCPIDLVCRSGAGATLLDTPSRLEKIVRGMNAVSGEIPITVKIRTGTKDAKPTAQTLLRRLAFGTGSPQSAQLGPAGVAAVTLHGRSKAQRYTKSANWDYIAECASIVKEHQTEEDDITDTVREVDPRHQNGKMYFLGNGDVYSHIDYYKHLEESKVDAVMLARGALIKPWIFEEIIKGQYLDKSGSERLAYVEKFVRYGLEYWGSDEMGVGTTRRFLLESLSFTSRYTPVGILEHLPPKIQDRATAWTPRSDLEGLMSSEHPADWIKISEMFLGPAHKDFIFTPKHRSKSSELEAEG